MLTNGNEYSESTTLVAFEAILFTVTPKARDHPNYDFFKKIISKYIIKAIFSNQIELFWIAYFTCTERENFQNPYSYIRALTDEMLKKKSDSHSTVDNLVEITNSNSENYLFDLQTIVSDESSKIKIFPEIEMKGLVEFIVSQSERAEKRLLRIHQLFFTIHENVEMKNYDDLSVYFTNKYKNNNDPLQLMFLIMVKICTPRIMTAARLATMMQALIHVGQPIQQFEEEYNAVLALLEECNMFAPEKNIEKLLSHINHMSYRSGWRNRLSEKQKTEP